MPQPLPSDENLLMLADILHNHVPNRKYDTIAVGAIGLTPFKVELVVGINSSIFSEVKLTLDRITPPIIRNSPFVKKFALTLLQEPYHAEVSIILCAQDKGLKVLGLASSRKICALCDDFMVRHHNTLANCAPIDAWKIDNIIITQAARSNIKDLNWVRMTGAVPVREK